MGQYLASYYCRYESLSSHQNFGSYFFIFGKCGVTQHRLYRDSLTLISLIPRDISGKCVFLCNNNWVKKQPPVVISKKRFLKYFTNFTCEICEIFKNTYSEEHERAAASMGLLFRKALQMQSS